MEQNRKTEYFCDYIPIVPTNSVAYSCGCYYKQERDWTCSIACIRTMMSKFNENVQTEDYFINTFNIKPGPHYSNEIKQLKILEDYRVIYGSDIKNDEKNVNTLIGLMNNGYAIMIESMINYAHWLVMLGYYIIGDSRDIESHKVLVYDPYYNKVRLIIADEFLSMWIDGDHEKTGVVKDFIAIKSID